MAKMMTRKEGVGIEKCELVPEVPLDMVYMVYELVGDMGRGR
jgi:hypothetical protein